MQAASSAPSEAERHSRDEQLRLMRYLEEIQYDSNGLQVRTPEERRIIEATNESRARCGERPLTEQEENLWVAQARMIGAL